ncbi:uncharacterized protein [Ptychodera flava]|uniref:uncharacterized protein n=1 Tax=Ptychodera flava TaxID=63121 RepID=UPI00396A1AB0
MEQDLSRRQQSKECKVVLLNLTARYAQSWSHWEGIREFIQNWHDGIYDASDRFLEQQYATPNTQRVDFILKRDDGDEVMYEAIVTMPRKGSRCFGSLHYDKSNKRLTLINRGISLQKKILILGYTSKTRNNQNIIGQFGEGLKIGALALVRQGRYVTMETNKERWQFALHPYEHYGGEQGLVVLVTKSDLMCAPDSEHLDLIFPPCPVQLCEDDTSSSISSIYEEEFEICRKRFLFLTPPSKKVVTEIGTLLLDKQFTGDLFVKGSFVVNLSDNALITGVNFFDLKIDRDRNAVPQLSEIDHKVSCMWPRAVEHKPQLAPTYYELLEQHPNCRDVKHAINYACSEGSRVPKLIAEEFRKKSPENAFPVVDTHPANDLPNVHQELGLPIIQVNEILLSILHKSGEYKSLAEVRESRRPDKSNLRHVRSLTKAETKVIYQAVKTANTVDPHLTMDMIDVIDTKNEEKPAVRDNRLEIPKWMVKIDVVHKYGEMCKMSRNKCWCRQIRICNALLSLRKDQIEAQPGRHAMEFPPDQVLMGILSQFTGRENEMVPPYCLDVHQRGNVLNHDTVHAHCVETEEQLRKEIKTIKIDRMNIQKDHQEELAKLNHDCTLVRKDLMNSMVRDADADLQMEKLGEEYSKKLEEYKDGIKAQLTGKDDAIKELREYNLELDRELIHKRKLLEEQHSHVDRFSKSIDYRHVAMVEKVQHYKKTLEEKAKKVLTLETKKKKDAEFAHTLCRQIVNTCYDICSELEGQTYMCVKCRNKKRSFIVFPCCHYKFCEDCAALFKGKQCPVQGCKKQIQSIQKMYE